MKRTLLTLLLAAVALFGIGIATDVLRVERTEAASFRFVQAKATQLHTSISSSATSIRVRNFRDLAGNVLTMTSFGDIGYATIDSGTIREESVSFTGVTDNGDNTVTLTGVTRGLLGKYPYGAGGVAFSHTANAVFVVTNGADFYNQFAVKVNTETISGVWTFARTALPKIADTVTDADLTASGTSTLATVNYVNTVGSAGAADASETVAGIIELATADQASTTVSLGETTRRLVIPASMTAASSTNLGGPWITMTNTLGKLSQSFLDIFITTNTWSGTNTNAGVVFGYGDFVQVLASTTITGNSTPQPIFISTTTNALLLSDANDTMASQFVGFAVSNGTNGATTTIQVSGVVKGFAGLSRGAKYYVQDAVGTIGTTVGTYEIPVGYAVSSSELVIEKREWAYLGSSSLTTRACTGTTCAASTTAPLFAEKAVVKSYFTGSCAGFGVGVQYSHTIFKIGATSVTDQTGGECSSATIVTNIVSSSWSATGNIDVTFTSEYTSGSISQSGTVYFYR